MQTDTKFKSEPFGLLCRDLDLPCPIGIQFSGCQVPYVGFLAMTVSNFHTRPKHSQ